MPRSFARVLTSLASLGLVACASGNAVRSSIEPGATSASTAGSTSASISASSPEVGRTYLSTSVTGHTLASGTRISIAFDTRGALSAQAGCNTLGGTYTITVGGHLRMGSLSQTEMGCPPDRMAQDAWLALLLTNRPNVTLDADKLVITSPAATVILLDKKTAEPDYALVGTRWLVDTIVRGDSASTPPPGGAGWVLFGADGAVNVSFGCNVGVGTFAATGDVVEISSLKTTARPCPREAAQLETPMLDALTGKVQFSIDADALTLTAQSGAGLGLRAEQHP